MERFRLGAIAAAVWPREKKDGDTFYAVTIDRSYKDSNGQWQRTNSFDPADLLVVAMLADQAATYVMRLQPHE